MKRTLLVLGLIGLGFGANAQCIPNPLYQDSLFGVWPDTVENFMNGTVTVFYSDTLNMIIPQDAGDIDPDYAGFQIDSVRVDGVTGLPPGISMICNSQTPAPCSYLTGQLGCGLLEGTPTQVGDFPISLNVTAYLNFLGGALPIPQSFTGYSINILPNSVGIADLAPTSLGQVQNVPNPFANRTNIEFSLSKASIARVRVFNLVGEELWKETVQGKAGMNRVPFEAIRMESGVYLYKVEAGANTFTGRMIVNR